MKNKSKSHIVPTSFNTIAIKYYYHTYKTSIAEGEPSTFSTKVALIQKLLIIQHTYNA